MGKAKSFLCYFPPEVIGEIRIFKNLMGMSSGEFLMQAIAEWKKNHENLVQTATQINDLKMAATQKQARKYSLYLSPETFDEINTYKKVLGVGTGELIDAILRYWEDSNPLIVNAAKQIQEVKKKMKIPK